jgi:hypothetical protein
MEIVASGGAGMTVAAKSLETATGRIFGCQPRQIIAKAAKSCKCAAIMIDFRRNPFVV